MARKLDKDDHRLPGGGGGTLIERAEKQAIMRASMPYQPPRRINYKGIAVMDKIRDMKGQS